MDQATRLAAALTHRLRLLRGTQESFTVDLGDVFYQAASYEGDAVLIEITGDDFLPDDRRLTGAQQEQLLRLGFNRPDDTRQRSAVRPLTKPEVREPADPPTGPVAHDIRRS